MLDLAGKPPPTEEEGGEKANTARLLQLPWLAQPLLLLTELRTCKLSKGAEGNRPRGRRAAWQHIAPAPFCSAAPHKAALAAPPHPQRPQLPLEILVFHKVGRET